MGQSSCRDVTEVTWPKPGIFSCRRRSCSKRRVCFHSNQYFNIPRENVTVSNEHACILNLIYIAQCKWHLRLKISVQGPFKNMGFYSSHDLFWIQCATFWQILKDWSMLNNTCVIQKKKILGGIREIRFWKYILLQVGNVWPDWRAIPNALFVYIMTDDLHAGEIPRQSSAEDIWRYCVIDMFTTLAKKGAFEANMLLCDPKNSFIANPSTSESTSEIINTFRQLDKPGKIQRE